MQPRIEYAKVAPDAIAAMRRIEVYVRQTGLERSLLELVRLRASQINGCAYCVDMHTKDARAAANPSGGSMPLQSGVRRRSSMTANARHSHGPKPSLWSARDMFLMPFTGRPGSTSMRKSWWI